jgi:hypothetical protein
MTAQDPPPPSGSPRALPGFFQEDHGSCSAMRLMCFLAPVPLLAGLGCLRAPREAAELSRRSGNDLTALHGSYRALVRAHFATLRRERLDYVETTWTPRFLEHWVREGRLTDIARGNLVWSEDRRAFVPPLPRDADAQLLASAGSWSRAAIRAITRKQADLVAPLDAQEAQLTGWVDEAFDRLGQANAALTAQLASLGPGGPGLDAPGSPALADLLARIAREIAQVSAGARSSLDQARAADGLAPERGMPSTGDGP